MDEVTFHSVTEEGWRSVLESALSADVPEKSLTRVIEELRESNERIAIENAALQKSLDEANGRAARNSTIVAILGVIATLVAAAFL